MEVFFQLSTYEPGVDFYLRKIKVNITEFLNCVKNVCENIM